MSSRPAVAVFDAEAPPALAFVRALGRAGIPVHVYSDKRLPPARFSRHATAFRPAPRLEDAGAFLPWLRREACEGRIGLVAPTSDLVTFYVSQVLDVLAPGLRRAMPDPEALLAVLMKDRFARLCGDLGVGTPRTAWPTSPEGALAAGRTMRYPLLVKPRSHVGVGGARGEVVRDEAELQAHFRAYPRPPGSETVFERWPDLVWPVVQEYVPGALQNLYSVAGVLDAEGRALACAVSRKLAQWPPALGIGTVFEAHHDPALAELGLAIARRMLGRGLFELELIRDAGTGEHLAVDLNPRAYGQMAFEIRRGFDLPLLWYELATAGTAEPAVAPPDSNVLWLHSIPYHIGQIVGLVRGPGRRARLRQYRRVLRRPRVDVALDRGDPLSSLAFASLLLRHPLGIARSFFTSEAPPSEPDAAAPPMEAR